MKACCKARRLCPWQSGDTMTPFGANRPVRMKKLLENVEHALRRSVPVLKRGDTVLWMPGVRPAEICRGAGGARVLVEFVNRFGGDFRSTAAQQQQKIRGNKSMNEQRKTYADLKDELLITRDQIAKRVKEMGAEITRDFEGKDLTVICILKGAVVFFVDLVAKSTCDDDGFHGDFQLWKRDQVLRRGAHSQGSG